MKNIEDRVDYFVILKDYAERKLRVYKCLKCGREIGACRRIQNLLDNYGARPNMGNARGAMTNHLKAHMRKGEL